MADVDDTKVGIIGTWCNSLSAAFPADCFFHIVTCHPLTVKVLLDAEMLSTSA